MRVFLNRVVLVLTAAALIFSSFSCQTAGGSGAGVTPPDWVRTPPDSTKETVFFVGSASDSSGDRAGAEQAATDAMIAEITRYMGVKITSETSSEAKATLDSFQADMTQTVTAEGSAQISGFRVKDKWINEEDGLVTAYILGAYNRQDLEQEKARIAALFREQREAVSGPEAEGDRLSSQGEYFKAGEKYIQAAAAAATADIENARIKFERNINNARQALSQIKLFNLNDNLRSMAAEPFEESFRLKVTAGNSAEAKGLSGVPIRVSFKEKRSTGRMGTQSARVSSNNSGVVEFQHPVPTFVGEETLSMRLDVYGAMEPLETLPRSYQSYVASLEDAVSGIKADFEYTVVSRAKDISTGIVVLDADKTRKPLDSRNAASGLLQELTGAQFDVQVLSLDPAFLQNASDAEVISRVKQDAGGRVERVIFGVVSIDDFSEMGSGYMVKVSGNLKVAELSSGRLLYSDNRFKRARGSSSQGAISTAFRQLGEAFGDDMASELP